MASETQTIASASYSHRLSYIYMAAQSPRTMSTIHRRRTVDRITQMSLLLLYCGSNILNPVASLSSQTRHTDNEANIREGYYETLVVRQSSAVKQHDEVVPFVRSPNLISIHHQPSEAVAYDSEVRRTQSNAAACSANPECAAAGLVDDCCPTSSGMFLSCCPQTLPPGALWILKHLYISFPYAELYI